MSVYDLDAVIAEATPREPFRFKFGGEAYELPASPDLRAFAALTAERLDDGFRLLLGPDQWSRLQASDSVFDQTAFEHLIVAYQEHVGADLGESGASTPS